MELGRTNTVHLSGVADDVVVVVVVDIHSTCCTCYGTVICVLFM